MTSKLDQLRERFRADPGDQLAFESLEEAYFLAGDWENLIELYQARLRAPQLAEQPQRRAPLLFRLGQVWADRRGETARAVECFRQAVAADPRFRPGLEQLRRIHAEAGQWELALQIAESEAALPMSDSERAELSFETGRMWLEQLGDPESARGHFTRALDAVPEHVGALRGTAQALEACGEAEEATRFWRQLVPLVRGTERATALTAVARLITQTHGDEDRAVEYYRRALTEDPRHPEAVGAMARYAEHKQQWPLLADLMERRFEVAESDGRRVEIALEAARLEWEHLSNPAAATVWLARASQLDPDQPEIAARLADLARERGDEPALLRQLERLAELRGDATEVSVLVEIGSLHAARGDDAGAVAPLTRALERAPDDALAIEALSDVLTRLERWAELADVLERRAARPGTDPNTSAAVCAELGALYEEHLGDAEAALRAYARAFDALPSAPGVANALERIYRERERGPELRALLERAGRAGPPEDRPHYLCALGDLLAGQGEPRPAKKAYQAALALDARALAAHRGLQRLALGAGDPERAIEAFEREAEQTRDAARLAALVAELVPRLESCGRPEQALAWAERWLEAAPDAPESNAECARLHGVLGHDAEVVELLERLDPRLDAAERAANQRRLAAHHAAHGRPDDAIRACEAALEADPNDVAAVELLIEHLEATQRFEELARARRWLVELLPSGERGACLDALATLLAERLDDSAGAVDVLRQLAHEPDPPADLDERLEKLLELGERWEELAEHLEGQLRALDPRAPEAARLGVRRARILHERLGRTDEAAALFRAIRTAHPELAEASRGLELALRDAGDPEALVAFLAEEAASSGEPAACERAALERAMLLEETLGRTDEAREAYGELALAATDATIAAQAGRCLEALLQRLGAWGALRDHLEALEVDGEEEIFRRVRLARLCRDRLGDRDAAVGHLEAAAKRAPERAEIWRELAALLDAPEHARDLARVLEAELATRPDPDRELSLRARLGELWAGALGDAGRARTHYERLLELDPVHPTAAEYLIDHWQRDGRHAAIARLLQARLDAVKATPADDADSRDRRLALRLRLAGLHAGPLDDVDGAIAALEPLLTEIGAEAAVCEPLAELYERAGYTHDSIALCRRAADARRDPAESANWLVRLGELHHQQGELREAVEAYGRALDQRPDDRRARGSLRDLYRELGEAEPLARLLEADLEQSSSSDELALRLELARLYGESLGRPAQALGHVRRALALDPANPDAVDGALTVADALDGAARSARGPRAEREVASALVELLDPALDGTRSPLRRARIQARRARLLARQAGRGEEAAMAYREALALDPRLPGLRKDLRQLLERQQRWDAVLDCLQEEACSADPSERAALFEQGVSLAEEHLSADAALPWLERLRAERPLDPGVPQRIAAIHRSAERWEALLRALDDELELAEEPSRRRDLYVEKAWVLEEHFGSLARAAEGLECARREVPQDRQVLHALDRIYRASGRVRERTRVLETLTELGSAEDRVALRCELAALYKDSLGQPADAARHLLAAVGAASPESALRVELLAALGEALRAACQGDAWARCSEEELRSLDPGAPVFRERRRELQRELADVYERELGRPDAALRHLRALLDEPAPGDDGSDTRAVGAAETALLRLLRAQRSWIELERRLATRLERGVGEAGEWLELARLREEQLHALPGAAAAYRRVLELDPTCLVAVRGLRGVGERLGDWTRVAAMLDAELEHGPAGPTERCALLRRLGDVSWHELGSTTRASSAYAAALEANPHDFDALHSLQGLLEAMEDWRGALGLYESEIEVLGDGEPERRQAVWIRIGEIARDRTDEPERARRAYLQAASTGSLEAPRRFELAELHERCGDPEAFVEVFAGWCDETGAAGAAEQLRLGEALEGLGRTDEALLRVERALALDEDLASAWDALARLREARGEPADAADALVQAAERCDGAGAAERLHRAALLAEDEDADGAGALLRRAAKLDPGSAPVHAQLARIGERLGWRDEAVTAARRALDLGAGLDDATRVEVALAGGRAARDLGHGEDTARFFSEALRLAPENPEALAGYGAALAAEQDLEGARRVLEIRVGQEASYPDRPAHLAIVARALEASGELDAAASRYEEAIAADPGLDDAHARVVQLHERAGRLDAGVAALERWAEAARDPADRAERLLRAAAWELREDGHEAAAERHLREVLETSPRSATTWEALASLLWEQDRADEALDVATNGLEALDGGAPRATLALIRGRALERRGERRPAADAFALAAATDPRSVEAALATARLLRGLGDWRSAALALEHFDARNPEARSTDLAEVLHQLARLLAGPLEDVEGAVEQLRRAVALAPERRDLRHALAQLLSLIPAAWRDALAELHVLLRDDCADPDALHMLLRVARHRGSDDGIGAALHLLDALGIGSPNDAEAVPPALPIALAEPAALDDPVHEALRRMAHETREELARALDASGAPAAPEAGSGATAAAFRAAALAAEGRLAARALLPLPTEEVAEVLTLVAELAFEVDEVHGRGEWVNALSTALGRRARKRLRRLFEGISLDAVRELDFGAWRTELRALAAASAVDATHTPLRAALLAVLREGPDPVPDDLPRGADLTPRVRVSSPARALLRRAVGACLRSPAGG